MRVMALVTQVALSSMLAFPGTAVGQSAPNFVGAWRLVSYESRDSAGGVQYPLGQGAVGQLLFDANGHMSAMLMKPDRPLFASHDLHRGTDAEVRAAFDGFIAYFGPTQSTRRRERLPFTCERPPIPTGSVAISRDTTSLMGQAWCLPHRRFK
jgi:hypothetical protein